VNVSVPSAVMSPEALYVNPLFVIRFELFTERLNAGAVHLVTLIVVRLFQLFAS
jgi:hypothetical protein